MPSGLQPGERRGGRRKGTPNGASAARQAEIAASGDTPLDYMLRVMRNETADPSRRDEMARAVAPYVPPKLAAVEQTGKDQRNIVVQISPKEAGV